MSLGKNKKIALIAGVAVLVAAGVVAGSIIGKTQRSIDPSGAYTSADTGSAQAETASGEPEDIITLKTFTRKYCTSTPWVVGEKKGFFEKNGIRIEYIGEVPDPQQLPAVLNGSADIGGDLPHALALHVKEGAEIKAVTLNMVDPAPDVDPKFRHMRFVVAADSPIQTLEDIKTYKEGEKILSNSLPPSCNDFVLDIIFDKYGLDRSRIEYVYYESDLAALQALDQGNLDIATIHPPFYYLAEESGYRLIADSADSGLGAAAGTTLYYFTNRFIEENPEAVQRFVTAIKEAQEWANANEDEAIRLTGDYIGSEIRAVHYYYTGSGFPQELLEPWLNYLVEKGSLQEGEITLDDISTTQFQ
ncbi:MAG: ABC transporter substrate-binding protein [Clostridiales Family XIII bacterium]|jgi:ABC-type nitrate/sulfonate/bicarbonate transport system substrate-binding protein|nr:ABC transporter substrate-binding protein [Clostridiales Family XIII bacterium]